MTRPHGGAEAPFAERVQALPTLGVGLSTEYGAADAPETLDPAALRAAWPSFAAFLEVGVETAKGLDRTARAWAAQGWPSTYHFLDVNLDEPEDLDPDWLEELDACRGVLGPAWLCGDAGLWHLGTRDRNHMLLLPPVLTDESATALARGVRRLRGLTGLEVLPENPPGTVFVGDLHLCDFFARVAERADTGLLVDVAHLAIYQRIMGHGLFEGLEALPLDRVVEVHVAGGTERESHGFRWVEDAHGPEVLEDTWRLFAHLAPRAENLRAVVFECERNPLEATLPGFRRIHGILRQSPLGRRMAEAGLALGGGAR